MRGFSRVAASVCGATLGVRQAAASTARCTDEKSTVDKLRHLDQRLNRVQAGMASSTEAQPPLFQFGLIADIQHADIDDATNFAGSEMRSYRGALEVARRAVADWQSRDLAFVAQLGDLIDGQNAGKYGAGLEFKDPQSFHAIERVFNVLNELKNKEVPYLHAIGNHELYNFSVDELEHLLGIDSTPTACEEGEVSSDHVPSSSLFYYSISPHPGWRIVMLNGYEVSISLPEGSKGREAAEKVLRENHPHAEAVISGQGNVNYFEGLSGMQQRFVPFNGGFGEEQLRWLEKTLVEAVARWRGERVIILSHMPMHPVLSMACGRKQPDMPASAKNLPYDSPEVMRLVWEVGQGAVVALLAGHAHSGGHYSEPAEADHAHFLQPMPDEPPQPPPAGRVGLHHVTVEAALTHTNAFAHVEVYPDRLELVGRAPSGMSPAEAREAGYIPSRTMPLAPLLPVGGSNL